jgi:hypothetical protein
MNPRRAPAGVACAIMRISVRTSAGAGRSPPAAPALSGPPQPEAPSVPGDDGLRYDDATVPTEKSALVAAVDVAADDGSAFWLMWVLVSFLLIHRTPEGSHAALQREVLTLRYQAAGAATHSASGGWLWMGPSGIWTMAEPAVPGSVAPM